ncbi:hypothetical protein ABFA07_020777 [Porites harrisoni]
MWRSQPLVLGWYQAGNILLSFAILMAGASVSKVLLVLKHLGICIYSARTYFVHQSKFLFPAILTHWERYRTNLVNELKRKGEVIWCGDGRLDSMGHSAKYGAYTMFCCAIAKIVHFELVQAKQVKSSSDMELKGCQDCFAFLKAAGLTIALFVSDRHRSITKWIREQQPATKHFFDIWHVAKSVSKKLLQVGKESGCELLVKWQRAIKNHLHWCATSTKLGFGELILAKWKSIVRHVCNKHDNHPDPLFRQCVHGPTSRRYWLKKGTNVYNKMKQILMNTRLLNDIKKLSSEDQTSCLEGFHSTLNQFHPKMICFSWLGSYCRHILASLHFNENLLREPQKTKDGKDCLLVTYPKYKFGEEVVREIRVPPTYKYVDEVRELVFSMSMVERNAILSKYKAGIPAPLNSKFTDRPSRAEAIENYNKRKQTETALYPSVEIQSELQASSSNANQQPAKKKRKTPTCRKCKLPMKNHARGSCSGASNT